MQRVTMIRVAIVTVFVLSCVPLRASAEQTWPQQLTVTPSSARISAQPGATVSGRLTAVNRGTLALGIACTVTPYGVQGLTYEPDFKQLPNKPRVDTWVHIDPLKKTALASNETIDIPYSITIPATTSPGGYYAVIFAEATPPTEGQVGVLTTARVGHILYITVEGNVNKTFVISAQPLPNFVFSGTHITPGIVANNTGGLHDLGTYSVTIRNLSGTVMYTNQDTRYVLPETSRQFQTDFVTASLGTVYTVERQFTLFGQTKTASVSRIIVVDPRTIFVLGIVLFVAVSGLIYLKKHKRS